MAWPEDHSGLPDTPFEGSSLSTPQEARAAAVGHSHGLRAGIQEGVSDQEPRVAQPQASKLHTMPKNRQHMPVPSLSYQGHHF